MELTHVMAMCWLDKARAHSLGFALGLISQTIKIVSQMHVNGKLL